MNCDCEERDGQIVDLCLIHKIAMGQAMAYLGQDPPIHPEVADLCARLGAGLVSQDASRWMQARHPGHPGYENHDAVNKLEIIEKLLDDGEWWEEVQLAPYDGNVRGAIRAALEGREWGQ